MTAINPLPSFIRASAYATASEAKHDRAISEAQCEADLACDLGPDAWAAELRAQLAARGLEIVATAERDALVQALNGIKRFGELANVSAEGGHFYTGGKKPASKDVWQFPRHMLTEIDAALALAGAAS